MPDASFRGGPTALTSAAATIYTVPATLTSVVRHIRISNGTTAEETVNVSVQTDATSNRILHDFAIPAKGIADWTGFLHLGTTEIIQASGSSAVSVVITLSGVEST